MNSTTVGHTALRELTAALPVHLWSSAIAADLYGSTLNIVCSTRSNRPVGIWVCPLDNRSATPVARRRARLLPYTSPWIDSGLNPLDRCRVVASMMATLTRHVSTIELPMDPDFNEVAPLIEAGATVLCRHTRIGDLAVPNVQSRYLPSIRNHIRAAERQCRVERWQPERFDFGRACVGQAEEVVLARRRSALLISATYPYLCLAAIDDADICWGQAFLLRTGDVAVFMHSWFDRAGPRGVPSLLVAAAMEQAAAEWGTSRFDFEGSVVPSVDRFMAAFGARSVPYPHVRWQRPNGGAQMVPFG